MNHATILRNLAAGLALMAAAGAAAQSEPFGWSTSFDDLDQAGFVNAHWDTVAGTVSMPSLAMTQVGSYAFAGGSDRDVAVDGRVVHALDGRELFCLDGGRATLLPLLGRLYLGSGARAVAVDDGVVAVAMGSAGLRVIDARNPAAPTQTAALALPQAVDVALTGRNAYVTDGLGALHLVSLANLAAPALVSTLPLAGTPNRLARDGSLTVVGLGSGGFAVLTGQTDAMPVLAATVTTGRPVLAVAVKGSRAFVTTNDPQLLIYDLDTPSLPQLVATLPTEAACTGLAVDADYLYAVGGTRLQRWHLPFRGQPQAAGTLTTGSTARDLAVSGRHAFVAATSVLAVELTVPATFTRTSTLAFADQIIDLERDGDLLAVATADGGYLVDVANPSAPSIVSQFSGSYIDAVHLSGGRLVYASLPDGLVVVDVTDSAAPVAMGSVAGVNYGPLAVDDWRALTDSGGGLRLWDLRNPSGTLPQLGALTIPSGSTFVRSLELRGDRACVGTSTDIHLYDVANAAAPNVIATIPTGGVVRDVRLVGDRLLAAIDGVGLRAWDVGGGSPQLLGTYALVETPLNLEIVGDRAFIEGGYGSQIRMLDIGNISGAIQLVRTFTIAGNSPFLPAFGASHVWLRAGSTLLAGHQFATHAWQPEGNFAEILPQAHDGIVGFRASAVFSGDPDAVMWTYIGGGANWDLSLPADGTPTAWQYHYDNLGEPGSWNWNLSLNLGPDGNPPVIEDLAFEFLFERPVITAVTDVPNDQGRQLRLKWRRSAYDRAGSPQPLLGYALYRYVDPALGAKALTPPSPEEAKSLPPGDWDYLGLVPADGEDQYSVIVPSLADYSLEGGDYETTYLVRARTTTVGLNFDSLVLGGVSVDNLAPNAPQQLAVAYAGGGNTLAWLESPASDLRCYNVYRGDHAGFVPGPGNLVRQLTGTSWQDAAPDPYAAHYKVTAVDFAGNESEAAAPSTVADAPASRAAAFALQQNVPNPFNPRTVIGFSLERAGAVRLRIHDAAGRLVRTLHDGTALAAGRHEAAWEGLDDAGRPVAAGVYHCRLEAGGQVAVRRLTLVK